MRRASRCQTPWEMLELLGGINLLSPGTFYPNLGDGPSIQNHRITMTCFRTCSNCHSRSQAGLCHCTNHDVQPCLAHLRAPPVTLWGGRPPPVKLPTRHCPVIPIQGPTLNIKTTRGGISRTTPPHLATRFQKSPHYPARVGSMFSAKL